MSHKNFMSLCSEHDIFAAFNFVVGIFAVFILSRDIRVSPFENTSVAILIAIIG